MTDSWIARIFKQYTRFVRPTWSQEGEDILLALLLGHQRDGFYVDVGANHPWHYNNTFRLYRRGWHGINIDPTPGVVELFNHKHPRDINLAMAVAEKPCTLTFHTFRNSLYNTADSAVSDSRRKMLGDPATRTNTIPVTADTLARILDQHLPPGMHIDLLDVDVEGMDLKVLQSNDWSRFRPRLILAESIGHDIESMRDSKTYRYMVDVGYVGYSKLRNTMLFVEQDDPLVNGRKPINQSDQTAA